MGLLPATLDFDSTPVAIIDRHGEPWVTARDLARALGYADESAVLRIYSRNQDEFTEEMTIIIDLRVHGQFDREGNPSARIFSPRGCYAVGFFAKTDRAKAFRRWVLDVLEGHTRGAGAECRLTPLLALTRGRWGQGLTAGGYSAVSLNVALILDYLLTHHADGTWHEISQRQLGITLGISTASARKALHKLEEWELIRLEVVERWSGSRVRVLTGRVRRALKYAGLELPETAPALLN
jgi:Prophage antirepressor